VTVTADDKAKTYGQDDPVFSHQVSGLEPGDSLSGVSCAVTEPHAGVGDYDIICSGNSNANYSVNYVDGTLTVNPKVLTGGFSAADKVYDGTTAATVADRSLPGVIAGDEVSLEVSNAQFDNKNVDEDKSVTADLGLSGAQAGNYSLSSATASTEASITAKSVTGSFSAADKVYDGTTDASITDRWLTGAVFGDDVILIGGSASFDNKNVGEDKLVTGSDLQLAGADKDNYELSSVSTTTANISAKALTGGFSAADKVYDGTTAATVADLGLSGAQAGNYSLSSATASTEASITAKSVTGSFSVADKVYDGTVDASIIDRWLTGAVFGDDVSLSGGTATFASPLAGNAKTVTGAGFFLSGTDAENYALTSVAATTANISPAYRPQGFYSPVDMGGVYNTVKNGSTVPLKFEVFRAGGTNELSDTSIVNQPLTYAQINCSSGTEDSIESLASTNGTGLRYDVTGGLFIFNWQTPKKAGACYRVTVATKDGSSISALFKLK
jgi:hypothetical protein